VSEDSRAAMIAALQDRVGEELGVSGWVAFDQEKVDQHADTTGDRHWIHNDPDRAARETPFGGAIVQGSLLLSSLFRFQEQVRSLAEDPVVAYALNYGFDRVRFLRPVLVGSRVRARFTISDVRERPDGAVLVLDVHLEVDGEEEPAMVAVWLGLVLTA